MSDYKAEFLYPHDEGSIEEAGYEFANGKAQCYQQMWWGILIDRVRHFNSTKENKINTHMFRFGNEVFKCKCGCNLFVFADDNGSVVSCCNCSGIYKLVVEQ